MAKRAFRVGFYQFQPKFGRTGENLARIVWALGRARADLIVLPELALTGYYFASRREAEALAEDPRRSPAVASLAALCRERGFHLVIGFAERARDKVFNSSLLIGPRGPVSTYRKLHLFTDEKICFDPGDLALEVNRVRGVRVGMMICLDYVFPEVARSLALEGADLLAHPSNLVLPYCQAAMITRCLENGVFAVTANRFGADRRPHGSLRFTGRSQIVGPRGALLHRSPAQREEIHIRGIDPAEARDKRITPRNDLLGDRRPEFYAIG